MRELTSQEIHFVAGGIRVEDPRTRPIIRHPILRLLVALLVGRRPTRPVPQK
jgi:hypothetical protein